MERFALGSRAHAASAKKHPNKASYHTIVMRTCLHGSIATCPQTALFLDRNGKQFSLEALPPIRESGELKGPLLYCPYPNPLLIWLHV